MYLGGAGSRALSPFWGCCTASLPVIVVGGVVHGPCYAMLCYIVPCLAVLCGDVLRCVVLCCAVLCRVVLCPTVPQCVGGRRTITYPARRWWYTRESGFLAWTACLLGAAARRTLLLVLMPSLLLRGRAQAHIPRWGASCPATLPPRPLGIVGALGGPGPGTPSPYWGVVALPRRPQSLSGMLLVGQALGSAPPRCLGGRMGFCFGFGWRGEGGGKLNNPVPCPPG